MNTINSRKTLDQVGFILLAIVDGFASKINLPLNRFKLWPGATLPKWSIYPDGRVQYDFGDETFIVIGEANGQILVPVDTIDITYGDAKIVNTDTQDINDATITNSTDSVISRQYTYKTETTSTVSTDITKLVELAITDTFGIGGSGSSLPVNISQSIAQKYSTTIKNTIQTVNSTSSTNEVSIDVPPRSAVKISTTRTLSQQTQDVDMNTSVDFNGIQFVSAPSDLRPGEKFSFNTLDIKFDSLEDLVRDAQGLKPIDENKLDKQELSNRRAVSGHFIGYDPRTRDPEYYNITLNLEIGFDNASTDNVIAKAIPL